MSYKDRDYRTIRIYDDETPDGVNRLQRALAISAAHANLSMGEYTARLLVADPQIAQAAANLAALDGKAL